ncbi:hypothetical protein AB1K54_15960 [Microbacterium sp. BWT-B31]|uniref:hypothetical protein n=1 Tax=Microbacterium sp. BWT-B31 TaxID=3232072 RepID=UPI0035279D9E
MIRPGERGLEDDVLWSGLNEHVRETLGFAGVSKMLGARDDETAKERWLGRVRGELDALGRLVPLTPHGHARVAVGDGVAVQFGIHEAIVVVEGKAHVRTMIAFHPAAVVLAAVGHARWGSRWDEALAERVVARTVVRRDDPGTDAELFPWVGQKPGSPGPWIAAVSADEAQAAARAEDLGIVGVTSVFHTFEEHHP